jgi:hypothetical protein
MKLRQSTRETVPQFELSLNSGSTARSCDGGLVQHTHTATTQLLEDPVVGDGLTDKRVGIRHLGEVAARRRVNELQSTN